jgi:lipopolysaccharide cholinephosphotransferase
MRKFFINLFCIFIQNKVKRHAIRKILLHKGIPNDIKLYDAMQYIVDLVKVQTDIAKIPKASGSLKIVQDCSLSMLAYFDEIAKRHKITYWIDSGTLIGYIRHNGFIPWDDDIDIAMLRTDYEKILPILKTDFANNGFHFVHGEITRLYYKNTPAQIDIFPMDCGWQKEPLVGIEYINFLNKLNKIKHSMNINYEKLLEQLAAVSEECVKNTLNARDNILMQGKKAVKDGFLFYGVETHVKDRSLFYHDDIFPLKPISFYGIKTHIPKNWDYYLFLQYGDYMTMPSDYFQKHDDIMGRLNKENYKECQKLIRKYFPKDKADEK